jgi:hypothetical protein
MGSWRVYVTAGKQNGNQVLTSWRPYEVHVTKLRVNSERLNRY